MSTELVMANGKKPTRQPKIKILLRSFNGDSSGDISEKIDTFFKKNKVMKYDIVKRSSSYIEFLFWINEE